MESEQLTFVLTIRYINGECHKFELTGEENPAAQANLASRLQKIFGSDIMLDLGDKFLMIPMQNIQSLEISPVPPKLPDLVIRNARQIQ